MKGVRFPDAVMALFLHLDGMTVTVEAAGAPPRQLITTTYKDRQGLDFAKHLPAVRVARVGGTESDYERVDRIEVTCWAVGNDAQNTAEAIREYIAGEPLFIDEVGSFDEVAVDVIPRDIPYPDDRIRQSTATYRLTSRSL